MSDAPGLTKYWTVPGGSLLLEEPQPKTFIPRWGLSFASEAVYLASEVEAREREMMSDVEKISVLAFDGLEAPKTSLGEIYRISQRLLGRLR